MRCLLTVGSLLRHCTSTKETPLGCFTATLRCVRVALCVYTPGNIGPTSTGPHLDVKRSDRGEFNPNALDNFVEVEDPELGRVLLDRYP